MGKRRKQNIRELPPAIKFEIEENAEELMEDFLARESNTIPWEEPVEQEIEKPKLSIHHELDLHGLSVGDSVYRVDSFITSFFQSDQKTLHLKIITGKGLHSGLGGPVLFVEIYDHVKAAYKKRILKISPPPQEQMIDGVPLKGYFDVIIRKKGF